MDSSSIKHLELTAQAFNNMKKLKFLKIYEPNFQLLLTRKFSVPTTGLESISRKITYFHWNGYPGKSLPSNFCGESIVELNLNNSKVETHWEGVQVLFINFSL